MCNRNRCRRSDVTGRGTVGHDNGDKCCVASPGSVTWRVTHDGQHVTRDSQRTSAPHRAILRFKSSIYSVVKCGNKVKQLGTLRGSYCSSQNISEMNKENAIMHSMHASNCGHFWTRDKTQNASLAPCTAHCTMHMHRKFSQSMSLCFENQLYILGYLVPVPPDAINLQC